MNVISIVNYKGGVGKTTITANLGAQLAKLGYKTLLIDTDPQSNLTLSFIDGKTYKDNYLDTHTIRNLFTKFIDENDIPPLKKLIIKPKTFKKTVNKKLDLLCSHIELFDIMNDLFSNKLKLTKGKDHLTQLNLQSVLRNAIKQVEGRYDFVLIDCSPNFNLITQNAIVASDHYIVPIKLDFLSTDGLLQLDTLIKNLTNKYNLIASHDGFSKYDRIEPTLLGIVPNMVTIRNQSPISTQQHYLDRISNDLPIFDTFLRVNTTDYFEAPEKLMPVVLDSKNTLITDEIKSLTNEFLDKVGVTCKISM